MINEEDHSLYSTKFSTFSSKRSVTFWKALKEDKSPIADQIIEDLLTMKTEARSLDLLEYLVILYVLSGMEPFWASKRLKSYGYPTILYRGLGEETRFKPSTIYSTKTMTSEETKRAESDGFDYEELLPIIEGNQIVVHFMGETSLDRIITPHHWLIFLPKGTKMSIKREPKSRVIKLSNRYSTITITITQSSIGTGLPYSIATKEENYDEKKYATADFDIKFEASFSKMLSLLPRIEDYYNWTSLTLRKLVANFALSRKGIIEEIELP